MPRSVANIPLLTAGRCCRSQTSADASESKYYELTSCSALSPPTIAPEVQAWSGHLRARGESPVPQKSRRWQLPIFRISNRRTLLFGASFHGPRRAAVTGGSDLRWRAWEEVRKLSSHALDGLSNDEGCFYHTKRRSHQRCMSGV